MKKFVIFFLLVTGGILLFYWQNLRGAGPAIQKPKQDIAALNTTGLPLTLPEGFSISVFAKNLMNPRVMIFDPEGSILTSITSEGKVVAIFGNETKIVIQSLNKPHGLAISCKDNPCKLYVAETNSVSVYDYDAKTFAAANKKKIIDLPGGGGHFTRTLLIQNDKLYISVGSSCNVCIESDSRRAKVLVSDLDGKNLKTFSSGLRNAVFMTIHPQTGKIWVTEMGRDLLGDNLPPDEINILEGGKDYGWPYCYGKQVRDKTFEARKNIDCQNTVASYIDIPAHSAPLGLAFVPENSSWTKEYWGNLIVAYHGSWNRSMPTGYKVVRYKLGQDGSYFAEEDFISGWLTKDSVLGRPADILIAQDGTMYISDDKAGVIYKVTYHN